MGKRGINLNIVVLKMQYVIGATRRATLKQTVRQDRTKKNRWRNKVKGHRYHAIDTLCEGTMDSLFKSQGTSETSAYMVKMEVN